MCTDEVPEQRSSDTAREADNAVGSTWAVVLAGGEGRRLHSLTTTADGVAIPKQYCSLYGGHSLLQTALQRAATFATKDRICAVVAAPHIKWWEPTLAALPRANTVVEPSKCGTANGILLSILTIAERDTDACVVLLPADHYLHDQAVLTRAIKRAITHVHAHTQEVLLLGMEPDVPDPEYGYIMPGNRELHGASEVTQFVEKPTLEKAAELVENGALLNTFIVVAKVKALLDLYARQLPSILATMRSAVRRRLRSAHDTLLDSVYAQLPTLDFCSDLLETAPKSNLRVVAVPECGWTDLGTVKRVGETLLRLPYQSTMQRLDSHAQLNLAEQFSKYRIARQSPRADVPKLHRPSSAHL